MVTRQSLKMMVDPTGSKGIRKTKNKNKKKKETRNFKQQMMTKNVKIG